MRNLDRNTVFMVRLALRVLQNEDLRVLAVKEGLDDRVAAAHADLDLLYDECARPIGAAQIAECPTCFGEVEVP